MNIENFKIGDNIIITKQPSQWASKLSRKCPLGVVKYPYSCRLINIKWDEDYYAMIDNNGYGWSLSALVNKNCIDNTKEDRRDKLKKINNKY